MSVRFEGGKVNALLGKNGAGKSTLVKILAGAEQPSGGEVRVDGRPVVMRSAQDAFRHGIATVYQELSLIPELTVGENILLGRLPRRRGRLGGLMIDWPATFARAAEVLGRTGARIDVRRKVADLGVAQRQVVEIAKAMSFDPSVLMLDEPTSALAQHETAGLFRLVRQLADRGVAVVYITHRLQELRHIADAVTVLRDGRLVGTAAMADSTAASIVGMMFGRVERKHRPPRVPHDRKPVLQAVNLCHGTHFHDVNLTVRRGEVLGIAGMLGSGRTELLRALFGADPCDGGEIVLDGERVARPTPRRMRRLGLAFTPEERKEQALVQVLSTRANASLASLSRLSTLGLITRGRERAMLRDMTRRLAIKLPDMEQPVSTLSGGNQQKVVVAKWLNTRPRVILFDEPTRGIDVEAKQQIFQIMWDLSERGISSVFVSSELEELVDVCHRILVMKDGTIAGEVDPAETDPEALFVRCMQP